MFSAHTHTHTHKNNLYVLIFLSLGYLNSADYFHSDLGSSTSTEEEKEEAQFHCMISRHRSQHSWDKQYNLKNQPHKTNNHEFTLNGSSLFQIYFSNMVYLLFSKGLRVRLSHKPEQTGTRKWWHHRTVALNTLVFSIAALAWNFGFHSSDASVCRTVRQELKHKPSADSKDLQFCCSPAQHSFIPSRLCFERSVIWSQLASQIHFWQYAILPVRLTQNNSPQKAISTYSTLSRN